jgi:LysR family transcriptional regulator for metE and metH
MIERQHLAILREVSRLGSLTRAAETLCLTQSALSHAMRKLEEQLGTAVWAKDGRGIRLTEPGSYLLGVANRLLPQLEHAERVIGQMAQGQRGTLSIGIECHPCHRWLLRVVEPFLIEWPSVDVDIKQQFQFGGVGALIGHEIDVLVTPDPLEKPGLCYERVFDYEQVLVVSTEHPLAERAHVEPAELANETLIAYPVDIERLDVYSEFLLPAGLRPKRHKIIENTDVLMQMVAAGRGVAAMPDWLVRENQSKLSVRGISLGPNGVHKQLYLGTRRDAPRTAYLEAFVELSRAVQW